MMNIICESSKNVLNEDAQYPYDNWGERNTSFTKMDIVIGPDGTPYNTRLVVSYVNHACTLLYQLTDRAIAGFLDALPIIYTFQCDTMCTNGACIMINPGFVMKLVSLCGNTPLGVAFVILHEVYHNVFKHLEREAADPTHFSDHYKANIAQDYEINWIIEHTFPDPRDERSAKAKGDTIYDKDGEVKQIFKGITEKCGGCINKDYKDDIWEVIYDKLDNVQKPNKKQKPPQQQIPMTADMKEGYKDGWEDAIRDLRAKGLIESMQISDSFYASTLSMLYEALIPGKSKDYNAGYGLGYDAAMKVIQSLLQGGGGNNGGQEGGPRLEPVDEPLTPITPKFPVNQNGSSGEGEQDPNTPVNLKNNQSNQQGQQGGKQGNQSQQSGQQSGQQGGQQGGQSSQGGQQGNQSSQQSGNSGSGDSEDSSQPNGQGDANSGQGEDSSNNSSGNGGFDIPGTYKNGVATRSGSSDDYDSTSGQGSYDDVTSDLDPNTLMTPEEAKEALNDLINSGKGVKVGSADGGFTGDGNFGSDVHTISDNSVDEIAKTAGVNIVDKLDSPFKDKAQLDKLAHKLDEVSLRNGGSKTGRPGKGISGILGDIEEMLKPRIDWKEVLKDYLVGYFSKLKDIGYSKKGLARDAYYHISDYEGETATRFMLFVDTSGSMFCNPDDLKQCLAEINNICMEVGAYEIELVQFCDGIYSVTTYSAEELPDKIEFKNVQSGGTSYQEIFKYLEDAIDDDKFFNVAVIMTDSDCYYGLRGIDPEDLGFENKVIWMIIDNSQPQDLPYWTEAEQVIYITQSDFNKGMSFIELEESKKETNTTDKMLKDNKKIDNDVVLIESSPKRRCLNNKLYEDFLDDLNYDDPSFNDNTDRLNTASDEERIDDLLDNIQPISRVVSSGLDLSKYVDKITKWLLLETNVNIRTVYTYDELGNDDIDSFAKRRRLYPSYFPVAVINNDYSIDVYGELVVSGNIPDYIYFRNIKSCDTYASYNGNNKVVGSFTATLGTYTELPDGFPEYVDGNYKLVKLNQLRSLKNTPYTIGGSLIIQMCRNLKDTTNFIKTLYGAVLSDNGIDDEAILNTSIYSKSARKIKESIDYTIQQRLNEGRQFNAKNVLNEAFKSNILRKLFNMPENKKVLNAIKDINIFWSEIPDDIVLPCYGSDNRGNNVQRSLALRRVVNKQYRDYGITIWCDKNNVIKIIGTGNNRDTYTDDKGREVRWKGNSWLYVDPDLKDLLNYRLKVGYNALKYKDNNAIKELEDANVKYDKKDVAARIMDGSIRNIQNEMMMAHLYLVPEFCENAYIIKGTNDIKDTTLNDPSLYKNFSYASQIERRRDLQEKRKEAVKGMYLSAKNATDKSPLYRRYFKYIVTDEIAANIFNEKSDFTSAIGTIKEMINSAKTTADIIRKKISNMYNEKLLDPLEIDALNDCLKSTQYRTFILKASKNLEIIKSLKDARENVNDVDGYSSYRDGSYRRSKLMNDINIFFAKPDISYTAAIDTYGNLRDSYDINFVKYYLSSAEKLATMLSAIMSFENGNKKYIDELVKKEFV